MKKLLLPFFTLLFLAMACDKQEVVENPYEEIDQTYIDSTNALVLDSTTISGIHKLILEPKCATTSCHGGTFEPDFRTPSSTWSTLVWQPVVKNNQEYEFSFRAIPGDTTMSWFHERLVTDDVFLGQMPRYQPPLVKWEMDLINKWILDGCKDVYGLPAGDMPDQNISFWDLGCVDLQGNEYHTTRPSWAEPYIAPANTFVIMPAYAFDWQTSTQDFKEVDIRFSTSPFFTSDIILPDTTFFNTEFWVWMCAINTAAFPTNQPIYYRFRGRDLTHSTVMEFPKSQSIDYFFGRHSFIVQ